MELYRDPTEYGIRVAVECLPRGINARPIAWPAVARARHRPHVMNYDEYEYPISNTTPPLFVGIEEQRAKS